MTPEQDTPMSGKLYRVEMTQTRSAHIYVIAEDWSQAREDAGLLVGAEDWATEDYDEFASMVSSPPPDGDEVWERDVWTGGPDGQHVSMSDAWDMLLDLDSETE